MVRKIPFKCLNNHPLHIYVKEDNANVCGSRARKQITQQKDTTDAVFLPLHCRSPALRFTKNPVSLRSVSADSFLHNVAQMLSYSPEMGSKEMILDECTGCGIGCFSCNNTDECIPQRKNCDGMVDCSNGFDEWNCGKLARFAILIYSV